MITVYFRVYVSDTQNCLSDAARTKLSSPTKRGGSINVQLVNETQIIWRNGYAVNSATNTSAGATYRDPISLLRPLEYMLVPQRTPAHRNRPPHTRPTCATRAHPPEARPLLRSLLIGGESFGCVDIR